MTTDTPIDAAAGADWVRVPREALRVLEAAKALTPLLEAGWDEYDLTEDQNAGSAACDELVAATNDWLSSAPRPDAGENTARQELNAITDYIMGYWPLSMCYVNPMQAIQVMVNRMVKAESVLKDARPDAGEGPTIIEELPSIAVERARIAGDYNAVPGLVDRYEVQRISDGKKFGAHIDFRVTDKKTDSRIATCYQRENADLIVAALNRSDQASALEAARALGRGEGKSLKEGTT